MIYLKSFIKHLTTCVIYRSAELRPKAEPTVNVDTSHSLWWSQSSSLWGLMVFPKGERDKIWAQLEKTVLETGSQTGLPHMPTLGFTGCSASSSAQLVSKINEALERGRFQDLQLSIIAQSSSHTPTLSSTYPSSCWDPEPTLSSSFCWWKP